jgi:hypothetical protein
VQDIYVTSFCTLWRSAAADHSLVLIYFMAAIISIQVVLLIAGSCHFKV